MAKKPIIQPDVLAAMIAEGRTVMEVAAEFGVTRQAVLKHMRRRDLVPPPRPRRKRESIMTVASYMDTIQRIRQEKEEALKALRTQIAATPGAVAWCKKCERPVADPIKATVEANGVRCVCVECRRVYMREYMRHYTRGERRGRAGTGAGGVA